jgi:2-amino-4-deoxychorismate synthase
MPHPIPVDGPFALLCRHGRDRVELLRGDVHEVATLADIPLDTEVLALVPFRQVRERGFECVDDSTPLSVLRVQQRSEMPVAAAIEMLPTVAVRLHDAAFDIDDSTYAGIVDTVLRQEIGRGEGSNFVIHRTFTAALDGDPLTAALATFGRLLSAERGAYWTFLVHTGERTLVGATPERHVSVEDGLILMNPISGTYRHPGGTLDRAALLAFLADRKEIDELAMVLDEELKMMATIADLGGQVLGPYLKPMAHLVHTEYLLAGRGQQDVREVLRETMFAPTVVGSPIENACRVVARHERRGRGYYGGVLALIGHDAAGRQTLDAPILIRTAEFVHSGVHNGIHSGGSSGVHSGLVRVPVGATLVRHSDPATEVAETHAKAAGVLAALGLRGSEPAAHTPAPTGSASVVPLATDPEIQAALVRRNAALAPFWLQERASGDYLEPVLAGRRVLVVDAEDTFTGMLTHQLRVLGLSVTRRRYQEIGSWNGFDLVVPGPGPGDPRRRQDPKMAALHALVAELLRHRQPMLAVCLGHQVLSAALGLPLHRKAEPYQGLQREIDYFGRSMRVGFYSTFAARSASGWIDTPHGVVQVSRDPDSGDVFALRGPTFAGVQFHPESVQTEHGIALVRELVMRLCGVPAVRTSRSPRRVPRRH